MANVRRRPVPQPALPPHPVPEQQAPLPTSECPASTRTPPYPGSPNRIAAERPDRGAAVTAANSHAPDAGGPAPRPRGPIAASRLVGLGFALDALALLWLASSLPAYATAFHVPQDIAGLVFSADSVGFVLTVPCAGVLADRWGKRPVAVGSCLLLALGLMLLAASPNLPLGLLAATVVGAGAGAVESTLTAMLPDLFPGREGYANNVAQVFFSLGAVIAPLLLLVPALGWRLRLAACGTAFVLLAPGFAAGAVPTVKGRVIPPEAARGTPAAAHATGARALALILRTRGVGFLVAAMVLYTGVEVAVWGWLYAVVTRPGGAGPVWAAVELASFWLAMGAGRWATSLLSQRWPLPMLIAVEAALGVPALLLALLAHGGTEALVAVALCGLAFSGIWPSVVGLAQQRHGRSASLAALLVGAGGAGGLLIPAGFGFLTVRAGLPAATLVLATLLMPVVLLPFAGTRPARGPQTSRPCL